jgi:UDP-N-acetylmuramoyl-tripeptide--D-alanyl-D-alanine ligase
MCALLVGGPAGCSREGDVPRLPSAGGGADVAVPLQQAPSGGGDGQSVLGPLTREMLDQSLSLGRRFMLASQLPTGEFRYAVDFLTGAQTPDQNAVRQAGALWGLALIHQDQPSPETREAVLRGLAFYTQHSQRTPDGRRYVCFPGATDGESGAVALVALSLIDFLRVEAMDQHAALRQQLDEYLRFLTSLEDSDHRFSSQYLLKSGIGFGKSSPYFDGEIVLALAKAARYFAYDDLRPLVLRAADACYAAHARAAVELRLDDPSTKGHFQWACLACAELYGAGWPDTERFTRRAIDLADWMIDVHKTLQRRLNTGYAYEGIISAYALAQAVADAEAQQRFGRVIEAGLAKLSTWQVGSAFANDYLRAHPDYEASCTGGILSAADQPLLRIDTTQHQLHAVILARRYVKTCN